MRLAPHTAPPARRSQVIALAVTVALLIAGCASSAPPEPIRLGSAPTTATGKIDLTAPLDESGFLDFSQWPDACTLLTDRDVRAVFPQARDIRRKPDSQDLTLLPSILSGVPSPTRHVTVENASCDLTFLLPGMERDEKYPLINVYQLTVAVDGAGSRQVIRQNYGGASKGERRMRLAGANCAIRSSGHLTCMKGRLGFGISTQPAWQGEVDDVLTLRYQVGSEVTTFKAGGGVKQFEVKRRFEDDHIGRELATAVARKV